MTLPRVEDSLNQRGVTAIEYALVASLIFLVIIVAVILVGDTLIDFYLYVADWFGWVADRVWGDGTMEHPIFGESELGEDAE